MKLLVILLISFQLFLSCVSNEKDDSVYWNDLISHGDSLIIIDESSIYNLIFPNYSDEYDIDGYIFMDTSLSNLARFIPDSNQLFSEYFLEKAELDTLSVSQLLDNVININEVSTSWVNFDLGLTEEYKFINNQILDYGKHSESEYKSHFYLPNYCSVISRIAFNIDSTRAVFANAGFETRIFEYYPLLNNYPYYYLNWYFFKKSTSGEWERSGHLEVTYLGSI